MQEILHCQALFGIERGAQIQALIEAATAEPCPCAQGRTCPLMRLPKADSPPPQLVAV